MQVAGEIPFLKGFLQVGPETPATECAINLVANREQLVRDRDGLSTTTFAGRFGETAAQVVQQNLKAAFLFALRQVVGRPILLVRGTLRDFVGLNFRSLGAAFPFARQPNSEDVFAFLLPQLEIFAPARDGIQCYAVLRRAALGWNDPYAVLENDALACRDFQGFQLPHAHVYNPDILHKSTEK